MVHLNKVDSVLTKDKNKTILKTEVKKRKDCYENQDRIKKFCSDNKDKRNEYFRKRRESDMNFKLAFNIRTRIGHFSKAQIVTKINKTFDHLYCSHNFLKN